MTPQSPPPADASTRAPAVAGRFYPGARRALAALVDELLDAATPAVAGGAGPGAPAAAGSAAADGPASGAVPGASPVGPGRGYVVPHAGYRYSGRTAATVYALLRRHAARVDRVVLIGPAHYVPLSGCAAPATGRWATPLGAVRIDLEAIERLATAGLVAVDDAPHAPEHSLEVQLPFLQRALPADVPVLPVVVGAAPVGRVAAVLAASAADPGTVVLCSTDLSHYLDQAAAVERDTRTVRAVLDLAEDWIGRGDACGEYALRGLVGWAREAGLSASLLHQCTSADASGDTSRVVGYAAVEFTPPE